MIVNLAERAHNHNWRLDPVTRSLLDTDFYKLLMLQFIWKHFGDVEVAFTLLNRSTQVRLGDRLHIEELRQQLDHVRGLRFHKSELIWLAGNTFYGRRGIFEPAFLEWLEHDFHLPDYDLSMCDGQLTLSFHGLWSQTERLRGVPGLKVADFGTRRRHSFLWQEYAVKAMRDTLGSSFTGSSN